MILTAVQLRPRHGLDARRLHQAIVTATRQPQDQTPRVLWSAPGPTRIYIRHNTPIDDFPNGAITATSPYTIHATGDIRITGIINPDITTRGRRIPLLTEPDIHDWVTTRLPWVHIHTITTTPIPPATGHKPHTGRVTLHRVGMTVTGTVTDPASAVQAHINGIGHGKAYGCGLLISQPLQAAA